MGKNRTAHILSKMLLYALGRRPDEFGLIPDADGFVRIKDLLKALHEEAGWSYVKLSHLNEVLLTVPNAPFEIRENRIRCLGRDTLDDRPEARELPKLLYIAIRRRAYPVVHAEGIRTALHPSVVLAAEREMAERLGRRVDTEPVLLTVNVRLALISGVVFHPAGEGLFLANRIPADCLMGPALPKEKPSAEPVRTARPRAERPQGMPGSFLLDIEKAASAQVPESLKRRAEKGRRRVKQETWTRERPPWKK